MKIQISHPFISFESIIDTVNRIMKCQIYPFSKIVILQETIHSKQFIFYFQFAPSLFLRTKSSKIIFGNNEIDVNLRKSASFLKKKINVSLFFIHYKSKKIKSMSFV